MSSKAQYYETDQMGIIHHANYLHWFEEARIDMMEQMGMGYDLMEKQGIISPVLSVHCDYKSMARFGRDSAGAGSDEGIQRHPYDAGIHGS